MNPLNNTVVSAEMMKKMQDAGVLEGYEPVPDFLQAEAEKALDGKPIAEMSKRMRYLARKAKEAEGNRRHEEQLQEARERLKA